MTLDTLAYLRVSTTDQAAEDKASLPEQRRVVEALAEQLGRALEPASVFADEGASGSTANRPAFQRLLAHCQAHPRPARDGLVLVYRDDRWGRFDDPDEAAHWTYVVKQCGYVVRYAIGHSDDQWAGPLLRTVGRLAGRDERLKIAERARIGTRGAAEQGYWTNRIPFGYRGVGINPKSGHRRNLAPGERTAKGERLTLVPGDAREQRVIRFLFTRYATGTVSIAELTRALQADFGFRWHQSRVGDLLRNPVYAGDRADGRARAGRARVVRAEAFPALVPRDTWESVQRLLTRNRTASSPSPDRYPLSGLLRCATCGHGFVGGGRAGPRPADDPLANWFYKDSGYTKDPACPGHLMTFLAREVEPQVVAAIGDALTEGHAPDMLRDTFARLLQGSGETLQQERAGLQTERRTLEAQQARIVDAIANGTLTETMAQAKLSTIRGELTRVTSRLERGRFDARRRQQMTEECDRLVALASDFPAVAARLQGRALKELLRPWLADAVVDKDARTLTLHIRAVPACSLTESVGRSGQEQETVRVIRLKSRSEWATEREQAKAARRRVG